MTYLAVLVPWFRNVLLFFLPFSKNHQPTSINDISRGGSVSRLIESFFFRRIRESRVFFSKIRESGE